MAQANGVHVADARRSLIERVASSRHVNRSARLRDLLLYLAGRVLDDEAGEIHEQELGHKVFGRPPDYDTASDNIVRVHASMLRKRLEQYFASEGADEPVILEIPKGNYAPVFRVRTEQMLVLPAAPPERPADWRLWTLSAVAFLLACSTAFLLLWPSSQGKLGTSASTAAPTVRLLWSQVFQPNRATDIVLDDAAVGLYQELTGRPLSLSDYFDRDYLRGLPQSAAAAHLDERAASWIVLRKHSSFADANFVWKLLQMPGIDTHRGILRFARDYSFRELKADNAVLLGNSRSNPWIEPFEAKLGLRWISDPAAGVYYPTDAWDSAKNFHTGETSGTYEGYFAASLLPNLGGSGNVLIVSGTGGSAINGGFDFLSDEQAVSDLRKKLPSAQVNAFPFFEALIKVKGRSGSPRDSTVLFCRTPK
jgi:hypothetical protein